MTIWSKKSKCTYTQLAKMILKEKKIRKNSNFSIKTRVKEGLVI